jgi:hypothetical protein
MDHMSNAEGYVYFVDDLAEDMGAGDYEPEELRATLRLVGERSLADRNRALADENARLRELLS